MIDFRSRFEKFKADEISMKRKIICFSAKQGFDQSPVVSVIGLRYTEGENTTEWKKKKLEGSPAYPLPTEFQDLLKSDCGNSCSFSFALHLQNINKEILFVIGSAHIFFNKNCSNKNYIHPIDSGF